MFNTYNSIVQSIKILKKTCVSATIVKKRKERRYENLFR